MSKNENKSNGAPAPDPVADDNDSVEQSNTQDTAGVEVSGDGEVSQDELTSLKLRADQLGIRYHPSIGVDSLREKVNGSIRSEVADQVNRPGIKQKGEFERVDPSILPRNNPTPLVVGDNGTVDEEDTDEDEDDKDSKDGKKSKSKDKEPSEVEKRVALRKQANALVRVRVTCMNPAKVEWEGEVFTTGNTAVGTMSKYVPFNNDEGWHVPHMILQMMQDRQCQIFTSVRDARGNLSRKSKLIKEFAIEVMDPLTKEELRDLAQRQAMSNSLNN